MEMAKVTSKGQITIPISIRRRLGINEGDKILFVNKQEGVLMLNPDAVSGDIADYTAEAPAADTAAASPVKEATPQPAPVRAPAAPAPAPAAEPEKAAPQPAPEAAPKTAEIEFAPVAEPPRRKYIPPVEDDEPARKPAAAGGIDLSTLLDDIRSIGDL